MRNRTPDASAFGILGPAHFSTTRLVFSGLRPIEPKPYYTGCSVHACFSQEPVVNFRRQFLPPATPAQPFHQGAFISP